MRMELIQPFINAADAVFAESLQAPTKIVDLTMDEKDFAAGRKIACPLLLLWGATGGVGRNHNAMEVWPRYASDIVAGKALPCGHYLSEEAPEETYRELRAFFAPQQPSANELAAVRNLSQTP